jgi:hypothetical protein
MRALMIAVGMICVASPAMAQSAGARPAIEAGAEAPAAEAAPARADRHVGATFGPQAIQPTNPVENAFIGAFANPEMRPIFRRLLLEGQVAVALDAAGEDAAPRLVPIQGDKQAAPIFTSAARLQQIMGADAPYAMMTGRAALRRLAEHNVAINYMWVPMLTLEPEDVAQWLETPETPAEAAAGGAEEEAGAEAAPAGAPAPN